MPLVGGQQVVAAGTFIMKVDTTEERQSASSLKKSDRRKSKKPAIINNNHIVKRRTPFRLPKRKNDVYVNTKTNFKAYIKKCEKIFDSDAKEIFIHGLGAAVHRACKLAKQLRELHHDTLELDITKSTIDIIDDLEPTNDEANYEVVERKAAAVQIRVFRTALIGTLRFEEKKN